MKCAGQFANDVFYAVSLAFVERTASITQRGRQSFHRRTVGFSLRREVIYYVRVIRIQINLDIF